MAALTIPAFQQLIRDRYFATDSARGGAGTFLLFMEEVGELARIMVRKYGEQSNKGSEADLQMEDELADVLWVLICIANQTGINLNEALQKNFEKKNKRDQQRHKENPKLN
jgi:NTP pyrophosphatase (non-canonical NTP hydrolase)